MLSPTKQRLFKIPTFELTRLSVPPLTLPVSLDPQVNARVIYRKNNANGIIVKLNSNNVTVANNA